MTIFFSHSKLDYDSVREERVRSLLETIDKVLCPHRDMGEKGSMKPYLLALSKCRWVVVLEHRGSIGRGVYEEVKHALRLKIPVFVIRQDYLVSVVNAIETGTNNWVSNYATLVVG
jgi:hypothetical protein